MLDGLLVFWCFFFFYFGGFWFLCVCVLCFGDFFFFLGRLFVALFGRWVFVCIVCSVWFGLALLLWFVFCGFGFVSFSGGLLCFVVFSVFFFCLSLVWWVLVFRSGVLFCFVYVGVVLFCVFLFFCVVFLVSVVVCAFLFCLFCCSWIVVFLGDGWFSGWCSHMLARVVGFRSGFIVLGLVFLFLWFSVG